MNRFIILDSASQKARADQALQQAFADDEIHQVEIKPYKKDRSVAQNRLQHHWNRELYQQRGTLEELRGWKNEDFRAYNKYLFGVPIMKANPEFHDVWTQATAHLTYEYKLKVALWMPVTRLMNIEEMTWYLTEIQQHWSERQFILTTSDDIYYEAMGLTR